MTQFLNELRLDFRQFVVNILNKISVIISVCSYNGVITDLQSTSVVSEDNLLLVLPA